MDDIDSISNSSNMTVWMLDIANLENYYNARHQIIRVQFNGGYYDLKCDPGTTVPNRNDHLVVAILPTDFFEKEAAISSFQEKLPPGLVTERGRVAEIPQGMCFLTPKRQTLSTTNPQNASAGFTISGTNMFDQDQVVIALSPPLPGRDYTTEDEAGSGDVNNESVGLFINRFGTVLLKSTGASITLGKEGVHIGGRLSSESSIKDTGVMSDNPLARLIPSTIPTAGIAIPKLPNMGTIASIANAAMKFIEITDKATKIGKITSSLFNGGLSGVGGATGGF